MENKPNRTLLKILGLSMIFIIPIILVGAILYNNTISFDTEFTALIESYSLEGNSDMNEESEVRNTLLILDEVKTLRNKSVYTGHISLAIMLNRLSYYYMFASTDDILVHKNEFRSYLEDIKASNYNTGLVDEFTSYIDSIWKKELDNKK
jgi:hypothetical protein